jgi:hypothetical protein
VVDSDDDVYQTYRRGCKGKGVFAFLMLRSTLRTPNGRRCSFQVSGAAVEGTVPRGDLVGAPITMTKPGPMPEGPGQFRRRASRVAAGRRHGDGRRSRRLAQLGSITGLRSSLGHRPPLDPRRRSRDLLTHGARPSLAPERSQDDQAPLPCGYPTPTRCASKEASSFDAVVASDAGRGFAFGRAPPPAPTGTAMGPVRDPCATPSNGTSNSASASTARHSCSGERATKVTGQSDKPARFVVEVRRSGRPATPSRSGRISASTLRSADLRRWAIGSPRIEAKTTCPGSSHGSNRRHLRRHPIRSPGRDLTTSGASPRRLPSSPWRPTMSPSAQRSAFSVTSEHHPPWWRGRLPALVKDAHLSPSTRAGTVCRCLGPSARLVRVDDAAVACVSVGMGLRGSLIGVRSSLPHGPHLDSRGRRRSLDSGRQEGCVSMRGTRTRSAAARSSVANLRLIWLNLAGRVLSLVASVSAAVALTTVIGHASECSRSSTRTQRRPGGHRARHGRPLHYLQVGSAGPVQIDHTRAPRVRSALRAEFLAPPSRGCRW